MHTNIASICMQLSFFNNCCITLLILLNINHFVSRPLNSFNYSTLINLHTWKWFQVLLIIQIKSAVKEFQVSLFNTINSIQHYSFVCTQLNSSKYCYVSLTIQITMWFVCTQLNNQTMWFVCTQLNNQTVRY